MISSWANKASEYLPTQTMTQYRECWSSPKSVCGNQVLTLPTKEFYLTHAKSNTIHCQHKDREFKKSKRKKTLFLE